MSSPRPYPYERLPRMSREELRLLRRAVRALPLDAPKTMLDQAEELFGVRPRLEPTPLSLARPGRLLDSLGDPLVAICLEGVEGPRGSMAVELDPELALSLVDRTLGGAGGADVGAGVVPLDDARRGVLAYAAGQLLGVSGVAARVGAVVTTPAALLAVLGDEGAWVWPLRVTLGDELGAMRVWMPTAWLDRSPPRPTVRASFAELELIGSVVIGSACLSAATLYDLEPGDVLVLDEASVSPGDPAGRASLRFGPGGGMRLACLLEDGALTLETISLDASESFRQGTIMHDTDSTDTLEEAAQGVGEAATLEALADASIELTIELGRCSLSLGELSALRPGEVVLSGQDVGGRVTLRAGGKAIASGELVDVEGEVGVRLLDVLR
ncbi:MAG: YscQ/HrcQ family type III secretion apparatus protein [Deltaproteobacteria bacterium]|nr:YscQ/HrcQ family type III secretion apparatus protein [Deltaproteobacteria bacterium]